MRISWTAAGATDVGLIRSGNEDAFRLDGSTGVFLVADGMGGHAAGEVASTLAADTALALLTGQRYENESTAKERLREAFHEAQRRIVERCATDRALAGMGTTMSIVLLRPDGTLYYAHLGDSRIYHLHDGRLLQLTRDHTWTQQEVDAGRIPAADAKNHPLAHILTRVLTSDEPAEPDIYRGYLDIGDILLLCSDGLYNMVDGQSILEMLRANGSPRTIVDDLIAAANLRGGADNVTAVVIRIEEI